jgi:hypothetical protein
MKAKGNKLSLPMQSIACWNTPVTWLRQLSCKNRSQPYGYEVGIWHEIWHREAFPRTAGRRGSKWDDFRCYDVEISLKMFWRSVALSRETL